VVGNPDLSFFYKCIRPSGEKVKQNGVEKKKFTGFLKYLRISFLIFLKLHEKTN